MSTSTGASATLDPAEVDRFRRMAEEWWDAKGKFRPLHQIGPARIGFTRDEATRHFGRATGNLRPLEGLSLIDIGCGGGLVAEPLARLGARVTGIDPTERNIEIARLHAEASGLDIDYRSVVAEDVAATGARFDIVVCLEVVEHVPDVGQFTKVIRQLLAPGGLMIVSTLNRTLKSFALAIVGAEYVLRWLPRGTHRWDRFVTPEELRRHLEAAGLSQREIRGMVYNPLADVWSLGQDTDVNYLVSATEA
ncbi:MAG: bifunctional 2-polyprenyl-6-hydroxyphenol methylase/3-demethylubiquinol 3-O-methyltransferase UbiG [Hyphomicrobiaceae bacterium]